MAFLIEALVGGFNEWYRGYLRDGKMLKFAI